MTSPRNAHNGSHHDDHKSFIPPIAASRAQRDDARRAGGVHARHQPSGRSTCPDAWASIWRCDRHIGCGVGTSRPALPLAFRGCDHRQLQRDPSHSVDRRVARERSDREARARRVALGPGHLLSRRGPEPRRARDPRRAHGRPFPNGADGASRRIVRLVRRYLWSGLGDR